MANSVETMTDPRSALPNTFTGISAREIDFVTRFEKNWDALREIMGIARPIKREEGSVLRTYTATVTLEDGAVPAGAVIPYSKAEVEATTFGELSIEKYAKAVTIEDVNLYGAEIAVQKTDDAFLNELQSNILSRFYTFVQDDTSAMTGTYPTFQMAVAMAIGKVKDKFKKMHRDVTKIVVWVNTLDAYEYLGAAGLTVQTAFGIDYIKNFMGAETVILSSEITKGTVIAIPSDNMILYYLDPASSDIKKLKLNFVVSGETNLIGFATNGNLSTMVGESFAVLGMALLYEYADGVAINTIDANPT